MRHNDVCSLTPLRTYAHPTPARRSTTNFAYVPGGRTSPSIPLTSRYRTNDELAIYKGTPNDPTTFPPPSRSHGSYHWSFERLLAAGLVPLTTAAFVTSGSSAPLLDGLLGISLIVHSHIGVCGCFFSFPYRILLNAFFGGSLMRFWWTMSTSASSPNLARCSVGHSVRRLSLLAWACTSSTRMISVRGAARYFIRDLSDCLLGLTELIRSVWTA